MTDQVRNLAEAILPEEYKKAKFFAVLMFYHASEIGLPGDGWVNTGIITTTDSMEAMNVYANTRCPASQLIQANTEEELDQEIARMRANFKNQAWLEEYLYPYL